MENKRHRCHLDNIRQTTCCESSLKKKLALVSGRAEYSLPFNKFQLCDIYIIKLWKWKLLVRKEIIGVIPGLCVLVPLRRSVLSFGAVKTCSDDVE